jgi:hypothetical protein
VSTKKNTNNSDTMETTTVSDNRTESQDFGPDNGGANIAAAWQGLVHLFDAKVDRWDVTLDGVYAIGLTFDASKVPATETVLHDISYRGDKAVNRDLLLVPTYFWMNGETPAEFEDAGEMTAWMAKFFRGAGEGENNRSPQYVKDAISAYKTAKGIASRRGRPPKKIEIEALGSLNDAMLAQVPDGELEKLRETLERLLGNRHEAAEAAAEETDLVTA